MFELIKYAVKLRVIFCIDEINKSLLLDIPLYYLRMFKQYPVVI